METRRESNFSESVKKIRVKVRACSYICMGTISSIISWLLSLLCYFLLMMQLEKLGFIAFDKNMMFLILLRNGNLWLRMRHEKG
jgi:hypothetical protein